MRLVEYQQKDFKAWCLNVPNPELGQKLFDDYMAMRKKLPAPKNSWDYWMTKSTPKNLRFFLDGYKSKTQKEKEARVEGADKVYEDDDWKVYHIKTYEAAKQYGKGSTWCICGEYPGHENRGQEYFNSYLRDRYSAYYVYIRKHPKDPTKDGKYMVCILQDGNKADVWNQADHYIKYIPGYAPHIPGLPDVGAWVIVDGKLTSYKSDAYGEEIVIPDSVTVIGKQAFFKSDLESVIIPKTVTAIGSGAFAGCEYLKSIRIPSSVTKLGVGVCMGCDNLEKIELTSGITALTKNLCAFNDRLKSVTITGVITEIDDTWLDGSSCDVYLKEQGNEKLINWCKEHKSNAKNVIDLNTNEIISDRQPA